MAGGWWGENRDGRMREGRWKGRKDEGGKDMEGRGKDDGRVGKDGGRAGKDEERIREREADFCGIILKELFINSLWVVNWIWRFEEVLWELYRI